MLFFDTKCVMQELYKTDWCVIWDAPSVSHKNSTKYAYLDTPGSPGCRLKILLGAEKTNN